MLHYLRRNKKENTVLLKGFKKDIIEFFKIFIPAFIFAWIITTFFIANAYVPTGSMIPTIMPENRLIGNRLAYKFGKEPKQGDVIIFIYPDDEETYFVKRLIGEPGDVVEIIPNESGDGYGYVKVNGKRLNEPYLKEPMEVDCYQRYEVPEEKYFFMGDNRNNSNDARYWKNTYVSKEQIIAKVLFQYWDEFKFIK